MNIEHFYILICGHLIDEFNDELINNLSIKLFEYHDYNFGNFMNVRML